MKRKVAEKCVERCCVRAQKISSLQHMATWCIEDHLKPPEDYETTGEISAVCAQIVLLARIARSDLLWLVNTLARSATTWNKAYYKRLLTLIHYISKTKNCRRLCHVEHLIEDCKLVLFQDASFACDLRDSKSTSGGFLCVVGITHVCSNFIDVQEPSRSSHSNAEAEIISLDAILRVDGLPALQFWECVLETLSSKPSKGNLERRKRERVIRSQPHSDKCVFDSIDHVPPTIPNSSHPTQLYSFENDAAVIQMINKRRSANLRYVTRTHRVDLDWMLDRVNLDLCF